MKRGQRLVPGRGSALQAEIGGNLLNFPVHSELTVSADWVGHVAGGAGKPGRANTLGFERGKLFRTLRDRGLFPKGPNNPRVTAEFASKYPQYKPYIGEKLIEHHIAHGDMMFPIPESVHKAYSDYLHAIAKSVP
jgi:hypothetical protein